MATAQIDDHPVRLVVTDDLQRRRLTVFFRGLLALPHLVAVGLWGILAALAALVNWVATLIAGRSPVALHRFLAAYFVYTTRVTGYAFLLAEPWPPFGSAGDYPIDLAVAPAEPQNRLTVAFRALLAIPALLLTWVFRSLNNVLALVSWFYALATGRVSEGIRNLGAYCLRYETQTYCYLFLVTPRYPTLSGAPTA
jgi:ABC-type multidrug transport system fused ATPase/permease subunit